MACQALLSSQNVVFSLLVHDKLVVQPDPPENYEHEPAEPDAEDAEHKACSAHDHEKKFEGRVVPEIYVRSGPAEQALCFTGDLFDTLFLAGAQCLTLLFRHQAFAHFGKCRPVRHGRHLLPVRGDFRCDAILCADVDACPQGDDFTGFVGH